MEKARHPATIINFETMLFAVIWLKKIWMVVIVLTVLGAAAFSFYAAFPLLYVTMASKTNECENLKAQSTALCGSWSTQEACESFGDVSLGIPGNECTWDTANEKCVLKEDIDWAKSGYC
ncbi:MAG: hypothetical protein V1493_02425 [Candidatus Diapherotrites archaeon]